MVILDSLTTVQFLSFEKIHLSLYCCKYEPKAQYFYEDSQNIYITYFEIYFLRWF